MKGIIAWSIFRKWYLTELCLYMSWIHHLKKWWDRTAYSNIFSPFYNPDFYAFRCFLYLLLYIPFSLLLLLFLLFSVSFCFSFYVSAPNVSILYIPFSLLLLLFLLFSVSFCFSFLCFRPKCFQAIYQGTFQKSLFNDYNKKVMKAHQRSLFKTSLVNIFQALVIYLFLIKWSGFCSMFVIC